MLAPPRQTFVCFDLLDGFFEIILAVNVHRQKKRSTIRFYLISADPIFGDVLNLIEKHKVIRQRNLMKKPKPWEVRGLMSRKNHTSLKAAIIFSCSAVDKLG